MSALLLLWPLTSAAAQYRIESWTTDNGLPQNSVRSIIQTRDGYLWLTTFDGLVRFDGLHFTIFDKSNTKGLSTNRFTSLYEDKDGTLWIGTGDGGLTFYRDGVFRSITVADGMPAGQVFNVTRDPNGELLVSIDSNRFYLRAGKFISAPSEHQDVKNYLAPSGTQWTITSNGVRQVSNGRVTQYPLTQRFAKDVSPYEDSQGNLWLADESEIYRLRDGQITRYREKDGVIKSDQIKFRYKLEGLNTNWIDAGTHRKIDFPYLPPGHYVLRVLAANGDGIWNDVGASIPVFVRAPFWEKRWFWLLCFVAFAGVALIAIRRRTVQLQRKHAEREAFARRLIESQEHERKRLAGELHDSLGQNILVLKNWALVGLNTLAEDNPAREHLSEISETASLALNEVREIARNLRPYQLERLGLTNTIENMIDHVQHSADVEFITEVDNIDSLLSKDSEINLYRVVQECVNNVVRHSAATKAWLSIKRNSEAVQLTCRDNGRGFNPAISSPQSGIGLAGMAERVRMLGGNYMLESTPGKGVTISISIQAPKPKLI